MSRTKRGDIRKDAAETALIEAAERIFGQVGIESASLRAIAVAAGSANNYAVQYHFGSREGLVKAIFDRRLGEVEARRTEIRAGWSTLPSLRALLDLIFRPLVEQRDATGRHSYAAFLLGLRRSPAGFAPRRALSARADHARWATHTIKKMLSGVDDTTFEFRMDLISTMVLDALDRIDVNDLNGLEEPVMLAQLLDITEAILRAPSDISQLP